MKRINYNHLLYFYTVATEGGVNKAATKLNVSPQTISSQIASMEDYLGYQLFQRVDKKMVLNEVGQLTLSYAGDIFRLGDELSNVLSNSQFYTNQTFSVGLVDSIPKTFAYDLLRQCLHLDYRVTLKVFMGEPSSLIEKFTLNHLDLIISDQPAPAHLNAKANSHLMTESGFTFFIGAKDDRFDEQSFPECLDEADLLIPGEHSVHRSLILSWLDSLNIEPDIVGEFDDTGLMKMFGQDGYGVFFAPTILEPFVLDQYDVKVLDRTEAVKEQFYAITPKRSVIHPAAEKIIEDARAIASGSPAQGKSNGHSQKVKGNGERVSTRGMPVEKAS